MPSVIPHPVPDRLFINAWGKKELNTVIKGTFKQVVCGCSFMALLFSCAGGNTAPAVPEGSRPGTYRFGVFTGLGPEHLEGLLRTKRFYGISRRFSCPGPRRLVAIFPGAPWLIMVYKIPAFSGLSGILPGF
jgi:hypothetical protein